MVFAALWTGSAKSAADVAPVAAADTVVVAAAPDSIAPVAAAAPDSLAPPRGALGSQDHPIVLPELDAPVAPRTGEHALGARGVEDTVSVIRGITVQGTQKPAGAQHTATQTQINRGAIARFQPATAADALVSAPGVELIKTGPWATKVSFRGFDGERVLVMVDGVRLNTGRGHGSNTSLVSVDRLDQVDLTAGSGGAEYGSDAVGGVVNLITHRTLFAVSPMLMLTLGARGSIPGDGFAQSGRLRYMRPRLGAELNLGGARLKELVTPAGPMSNSGSRDDDFGARLAVDLGRADLDLEHTRHAAHDVGLPALNGSFPEISREATRAELTLPFLASAFGRDVGGQARLLAVDQLYRTALEELTVTDRIVNRRVVGRNLSLNEDLIRTRSQGVQPELRFGSDGELRLGAELRRETTSGPKTTTVTTVTTAGVPTDTTVTPGESVPHATRDVVGGSISSRVQIQRVRIETGARYDWLRSRADSTASSWSPPLDIIDRRWSLDGGVAVRAGAFEPYGRVASGFRAPNLEDRYFRGPAHGSLYLFGNPALVAERSVTYEAGVRANAGEWGTFRASAYRNYAENFIDLKPLGLVGGVMRFQYANLKRVQIDGIELTGSARIRRINTIASLTLPRGRDLADGTFITEVGAAHATLDVSMPVARWIPAGIVSLQARWSDGLQTDPLKNAQYGAISNPAFWTGSAELGATLHATRIAFSVRNLLDHRYREPLSFIDEAGRTYSFALKRDFELPLSLSHQEPSR